MILFYENLLLPLDICIEKCNDGDDDDDDDVDDLKENDNEA